MRRKLEAEELDAEELDSEELEAWELDEDESREDALEAEEMAQDLVEAGETVATNSGGNEVGETTAADSTAQELESSTESLTQWHASIVAVPSNSRESEVAVRASTNFASGLQINDMSPQEWTKSMSYIMTTPFAQI